MPYDFSRLNQLSDDDLEPQMPEFQVPKDGPLPSATNKEGRITAGEARAGGRQGRQKWAEQEAAWGPLGFINKPMAQFRNVLMSPDLYSGRLVADPINAFSKFTNWLGDKVQGRTGDTSDAWLIPNKVRDFTPMRALPWVGQEVTEADKSARGLAGTVLPMVVSHVAGYGLLGDAMQGIRALSGVRSLAVAAKTSPALAKLLNIGTAVGTELGVNAAALPFIDPQQGNLANVGDALGLKLPGRVLPTDTYGEALGKTFAVEGLAAPLGAIGALSLIKPFRRALTENSREFWNTTFWETMGDAGLLKQYDYNPNIAVGPQVRPTPLLPSGAAPDGAPQLPAAGLREPGGALALPMPETPYGSAIERNLAEATQVRQVQQQRQRLQEAGLLEMGPNRQLELSVGGAVDPETKLQIRALQMERGQVLKRASDMAASGDEAGAKALEGELTRIDKEIADLNLAGTTDQFLAPPARQGELDLTVDEAPDTRPEIDTFLAELDELDDSKLRDIHSRVWRDAADERNQVELTAAQEKVNGLQQQLEDINTKLTEQAARDQQATDDAFNLSDEEVYAKYPGLQEWEARERELKAELSKDPRYTATLRSPDKSRGPQSIIGGLNKAGEKELARILKAELGTYPGPVVSKRPAITPLGAKRMTSKIQKELALAQQEVITIQRRMQAPESLVGQQLELATGPSQLGLNLSVSPELPPIRAMEKTASEYGYRTPADYRSALEGWNRDQLRRLSMPDSSPEVAALVKLRTGRRVWQAKKADIIDALVEIAERRGRFLPPEPPTIEQGALKLTTNPVGGDAPLLDRPADLSAPGMTRMVDADGNEVSVPTSDYIARGMDPEARERLKMEILSKAIQNGEVQPPITPIPQRPSAPEFLDQGSFLDDLLADPTGQLPLLYATDQLPIYEAGGKNAAALIDEMRLRFQYTRLDNEAAQAQKDAFMAAHGWDTLSWEEKKKLGILGQGMFAYDKNDLIKYGTDVVRPATPQFNPELTVKEGPLPPNRPPAAQPDGVMLVNREGVPTAEPVGVAKGKPNAAQANAQAAAAKKAAKAADTADKAAITQAQAARQELQKRRERLAKQAQGASC